MQKSILTYTLVALMLSAAIIYFVAASEETGESAKSEEQEQAGTISTNNIDNDNDEGNGITGQETASDALAAQIQTAFFAIVGIAYALVAVWMVKAKDRTNLPYIIAIAGSVIIIVLYVASRTMALPIVGLQDDVGVLDIMSKVLQVFIIGIAASVISSNNALKVPNKQPRSR